MRFAEIIDGRVRYVLPSNLAGGYTLLPPNAVEIALDAEVAEGDVYESGTFRRPTTAELQAPARTAFDTERERLFSETDWIRQRHADRLELGIDDAVSWTAWLVYWQALRDLPDAEGFDPEQPVWPVKPE